MRKKLLIGLQETEENCQNNASERHDVVPMDRLVLEHQGTDNREHGQGNALLDDLQLHEAERSSVDIGADTVGRNHRRILKERHPP